MLLIKEEKSQEYLKDFEKIDEIEVMGHKFKNVLVKNISYDYVSLTVIINPLSYEVLLIHGDVYLYDKELAKLKELS